MVTVLAVAPLIAIFHQASTRHAVCEHGALVEPEHAPWRAESPDATDVFARSDDRVSNGGPALESDEGASLHGHTHCSVGTLLRSGIGVVAPVCAIFSLLSDAPVERAACEVGRTRNVLAEAPKTSPPRA